MPDDKTPTKRTARPPVRREDKPDEKDKKPDDKPADGKEKPAEQRGDAPPPRPDADKTPAKSDPPPKDEAKPDVEQADDANPADEMLPGARALAETRAALDGAASVIQSHMGRQENAAVREHLGALMKSLAEHRTSTAAALGEHYPDVEMEYDDAGMEALEDDEPAEQRSARKRALAQFWRNVARATAVLRSKEHAELLELRPVMERLLEETQTNRKLMQRMRGQDVLPPRRDVFKAG